MAFTTTSSWHQLSKDLAESVQTSVVKKTSSKNRSIKKGVLQVLLGFQGPAALIEVGYLSNAAERSLLCSDAYQEQTARGIFEGLQLFIARHFA